MNEAYIISSYAKNDRDRLLRRQNNTRDFNHKIYFDRIVSLLGN